MVDFDLIECADSATERPRVVIITVHSQIARGNVPCNLRMKHSCTFHAKSTRPVKHGMLPRGKESFNRDALNESDVSIRWP